jgi:hypothetical protein
LSSRIFGSFLFSCVLVSSRFDPFARHSRSRGPAVYDASVTLALWLSLCFPSPPSYLGRLSHLAAATLATFVIGADFLRHCVPSPRAPRAHSRDAPCSNTLNGAVREGREETHMTPQAIAEHRNHISAIVIGSAEALGPANAFARPMRSCISPETRVVGTKEGDKGHCS